MESIILMNSKWGNDMFVPMYLFFGSLSGGLFITAVGADLISIKLKHYQNLSKVTSFVVVPSLILSGIFVMVHLARIPFYFSNFNSWLAIGGTCAVLAGFWGVLYAALWFIDYNQTLRRILGVVGIPLLAFLSFYTGLLLSGAKFVPLWSMDFLPYLFLNSGLLTGLAGAGLVFMIHQFYMRVNPEESSKIYRGIGFAIMAFILIEIIELTNFMEYLSSSPEKLDATGKFIAPNGSLMAFEFVTKGELSIWYWLGIIWIGLLFPLILTFIELVLNKTSKSIVNLVTGLKFVSVIIGGVILRFVIVWGGELKAPLDFPSALNQLPFGG